MIVDSIWLSDFLLNSLQDSVTKISKKNNYKKWIISKRTQFEVQADITCEQIIPC